MTTGVKDVTAPNDTHKVDTLFELRYTVRLSPPLHDANALGGTDVIWLKLKSTNGHAENILMSGMAVMLLFLSKTACVRLLASVAVAEVSPPCDRDSGRIVGTVVNKVSVRLLRYEYCWHNVQEGYTKYNL